MHLRLTLVAAAVLLGAVLLGLMRPGHAGSVDEFLKAQMAARHIPGLSVAVVQDGKIIKEQGYGLSDIAKKTPATADTVYQIASLTKQFTAAAILKLREQGKLGIDDPVTRYLDGLPAAWSAVTVRELLNQTSGIPDYMEGFDLHTQFGPTPKDYTAAEFIGLTAQKPLLFTPGSQFRYSNTNYHLLGMIVEKVSGHSYGDFMQQTFFRPLGMTATQMARPGLRVPNAAQGTIWDGKAVQASPIVPSATLSFGDTGIQTTVLDLTKWDAALNGDLLLNAESKRLLWTPPTLISGTPTEYAAGWISRNVQNHMLLWHNGGTFSGFSGAIFKFPADKLTLIVLTNSLDIPDVRVGASIYSLTLGLAKLYLPDLPDPAKEEPASPDTNPQVTRLLRRTLTDLAAGKVDPEALTPQMQAILTPENIAQTNQNLASLGKLTTLSFLTRTEQSGLQVYRYRATYGTTPVIMTVTLTADGKIAGLRPQPE